VSVALGALDENSVDAEEQKQIIMDTAAMFYGAGTDTIVASVLSWVWAMLKNPHIQARVHDELDNVLSGRLPDFEDQEQLPYLMATLMESMR
jgi:cytochrome P450